MKEIRLENRRLKKILLSFQALVQKQDNTEVVEAFKSLDDLKLLTKPILDIQTMRSRLNNDKIETILNLLGNKITKEAWSHLPRFNCGEWKHDGTLLELRDIQILEDGQIFCGSWDTKTNKQHGYGIGVLIDKSLYEGLWN